MSGLSQLKRFAEDWAEASSGRLAGVFPLDGERSLPPRLAERARVSAPWRRASRRRAGFAQIHQILRDVTYWRVDGRVEAWKQADRQLKL